MKVKTVTVRNTETGRVGVLPEATAKLALFEGFWEVVPNGSKNKISLDELIREKAEKPEPVEVEELEEKEPEKAKTTKKEK